MFIIDLKYIASLAEIDNHINSHAAFLDKYYAENIFLISGRKVPRTGGIILANTTNKSVVEKIIQEDPFYENKLAEYTITEFTPSKYAETIEGIIK